MVSLPYRSWSSDIGWCCQWFKSKHGWSRRCLVSNCLFWELRSCLSSFRFGSKIIKLKFELELVIGWFGDWSLLQPISCWIYMRLVSSVSFIILNPDVQLVEFQLLQIKAVYVFLIKGKIINHSSNRNIRHSLDSRRWSILSSSISNQ
jgi:hypothetical protein